MWDKWDWTDEQKAEWLKRKRHELEQELFPPALRISYEHEVDWQRRMATSARWGWGIIIGAVLLALWLT